MTDLTKITTPFGLLDPETQEALRNCGGPWEFFTGYEEGAWEPLSGLPSFYAEYAYRQAPQPVTYPKIPWELLPAEFDRAAIDADGTGYAYGIKVIGKGEWDTDVQRVDTLPGFDRGTCDWRDSLVERPK